MEDQSKKINVIDRTYLGSNNVPLENKQASKGISRQIIKLIAGLLIVAIIISLAIFGIGKLINNPANEISNINNSIEESTKDIKSNDFEDDLNVDFIEESSMTESGKEVNTSLKEIDNMLSDINNLSDFQDMGDIKFNE